MTTRLSCGGFAPLTEFMGRADYLCCLESIRLANCRPFPIPITLPAEKPLEKGTRAALVHPRGDVLAILDVEEAFEIDPEYEAVALLGSFDLTHPYIGEIARGSKVRLAGRLSHLRPVIHADFTPFRLNPTEVRGKVAALGRKHVVASKPEIRFIAPTKS